MSQLPYGGREIAELRANRQKPADMVLVSLVGPLRELNPVVVARPERSYDWRFLTGLDVLIVASSTTDKSLVKRVVDALATVKPEYLGVWFSDKQQGLNIAYGSWVLRSSRRMGFADRRLLAGVGK